jgi:carbon monoxide dehydrogenase subunit G
MDFRIDAVLPATAAQLWEIFFDVKRVAALIPGCEDVVEVEPLQEFSAVMKQKIGPFKLEVPTRIVIESHVPQRQVIMQANGSDRFTGTTIDVRMEVDLEQQAEQGEPACRLGVQASMQVAGRLASLGYPIVRKRSEELFAEFERRLRAELTGVGAVPLAGPAAADVPPVGRAAAEAVPVLGRAATEAAADAGPEVAGMAPPLASNRQAARPSESGRAAAIGTPAGNGSAELVFLWPRLGINVAVALAVAHGAVALGQSPWWWLAAPLLGVAASLGKRSS